MTENPLPKNNLWTTEANASWNTRYVTPDGFICQLTLRGENGHVLLDKANAALAWLRDSGYKPEEPGPTFRHRNNEPSSGQEVQENSSGNHNGNGNGAPPDNGHGASWCPIHQCEMKRWEKNDKVWYSHKSENGWCTGKSK